MGVNNKALILIGMLSILLVFGVVGFGATLEVDESDEDCGDTGAPYCNIQDAVDAASSGDTITVSPGDFSKVAVPNLDPECEPGEDCYNTLNNLSILASDLGSPHPL
ncbi:hypothetical protein KGY79_13395 [Candidatus Bipolaricaulota bacterium]|nr:hypothetical protein [Candidatus Bipolaricaulota bacterium]